MPELRSLLVWLENSALGDAIRGAGVWAYGIVNLVHIVAVAALFGAVLILDLRMLGWRRTTPLATIAAATQPVAILGFLVAVLSGVCLLATNATDYLGNPFLLIKFVAIPCALINAAVLSRLSAWTTRDSRDARPHERWQLAVFGAISLLCWLTTIGAGRLIGYW